MLYPQSFEYNGGPAPWPAHSGQSKRKPNHYQYDPEAQYDPYEHEQEDYAQQNQQQYQYEDQGPRYIITGSSDDGYFKYILILLVGLVFVGGINVWKTSHHGGLSQQSMAVAEGSNQAQQDYARKWNEDRAREKVERDRMDEERRKGMQLCRIKGSEPDESFQYTANSDPTIVLKTMDMMMEKKALKNERERNSNLAKQQAREQAQQVVARSMDIIAESGKNTTDALNKISSETTKMATSITENIADNTRSMIKICKKFADNSLASVERASQSSNPTK